MEANSHHLPISRHDDEVHQTLLSPIKLGQFQLSHRVVLAPVTRCRALNYVPQAAHVEYYSQRTTPGGLLISEAVAVAQEGIGFPHSPGIWDEEQVEGWKKVVHAVHEKAGIIFCQLWHVGRASHTYYQPDGRPPVSCTAQRVPKGWFIRLPNEVSEEYSQPRALLAEEIPNIVEQFRVAARNAMKAGFDGVELHAGHGYLLDQFFKDGINDRIDKYGGSMENRCRFGLEVLHAIIGEIGHQRTSIRISPIVNHLGATDSNSQALGLHLIANLNKLSLAYLHLTEPHFTIHEAKKITHCRSIFKQAFYGLVMSSGGFTCESGMVAIKSGAADLISYGRLFISNPDLPIRFARGAPLNAYDRTTFYTHDQMKGYIDYAMLSSEVLEESSSDKN